MPFSDKEGKKLPEYFIDSSSIKAKAHIDIQAASQKWIDSSISKTINVPTDYDYEDFKKDTREVVKKVHAFLDITSEYKAAIHKKHNRFLVFIHCCR